MSFRQSISRSLLKLPLSLLVKSKSIPLEPAKELNLELDKPLIYALPFYSNIDLMTLQKKAKALGFPDPLTPLEIQGKTYDRFVFISEFTSSNSSHKKKQPNVHFEQLLKLHETDESLDIQVVPVSVLWGREPSREGKQRPYLASMPACKKTKRIITSGRDCIIRFSFPVSLRYMADHYGADEKIAQKLTRVAHIHFSRQKLAISGPSLPNRHILFERLLASDAVQDAMAAEIVIKNETHEKVEQQARDILEEIAADFSYPVIRRGGRFLGWLWNRIYQGLNIHNISRVRELAQNGHEIIYMPCHRSHMDYLLLSYVLYQEGIVPPHIAAGINLNFFPVGSIFRRGGAFFIRRSFKGDKLYSTIFKEYLMELFTKGYSVEFFCEGGRSRTGKLLQPKTGMLAMTLQTMMRGVNRPVSVVPVYIGYEHIMEVSTYSKELAGKKKEKESAKMVLRSIRKLKNFGQGYVNFGEPINLNQALNEKLMMGPQRAPAQRERMNQAVLDVANQIMGRINDAAAVNALSLCALALLSSSTRALSESQLALQIQSYIDLLKYTPYSDQVTLPKETPNELITHAKGLNKFDIESDEDGTIVSLNEKQTILISYYRNNILHLFVLPALIAHIIAQKQEVTTKQVQEIVQVLYPFLQAELFLTFKSEQLSQVVEQYIQELERQELIIIKQEDICINQQNIQTLLLLSGGIIETIERYTIGFSQLLTVSKLERETLESQSQKLAQRLGRLHGIYSPELFDKSIFHTFFNTLKAQNYIDDTHCCDVNQTQKTVDLLASLIPPEVMYSLKEALEHDKEEP